MNTTANTKKSRVDWILAQASHHLRRNAALVAGGAA